MKSLSSALCLFLILGISCSEKDGENLGRRPGTDKIEVVLPVADSFGQTADYSAGNSSQGDMPITRTLILGDGDLNKVGWAETDKVSLWAAPQGGGDYVLNGETFTYYTPIQGNALFTATIPEMPAATYIYYGAYPVPNSISGTQVTYTLAANQSGAYDGTQDIMLAHPASGSELTENTPASAARLSFAHKCHILRIQVPMGRNKWGVGVRKLRIKFPAEVVGDLTFDVTAPDAAPTFTNGSNTIMLNLVRPLDESVEDASDGNYVWVFVRPGVLLDGNLEFTAYSDEGYQSETISTPISKTLAEGRITPVTMTIPQELPYSSIDFSIASNNLGEEAQKLSITVPLGATLRGSGSKQEFAINSSNKYSLNYYNTVDGIDNTALLSTGTTSIQFESESAIVSSKQVLGTQTAVSLTVPYLFSEDFSNITTLDNGGKNGGDSKKDVVWGDACGLPGWSGNQYYIEGGKAATLRHRAEDAWVSWGSYRGRFDSSPMPLKAGKSVKVFVTFNYSGQTNSKNNKHTPLLNYGHTTEQGGLMGLRNAVGIKEGDTIQSQMGSTSPNLTGSFDNITQTASFTIEACTNSHRLSWDCYANRSAVAQFDDQWVYIDNIKVQIVK